MVVVNLDGAATNAMAAMAISRLAFPACSLKILASR